MVRALQDDRSRARRHRQRERGQAQIAKLNVDDNPDVARRYEVMSIPTLLVFQTVS